MTSPRDRYFNFRLSAQGFAEFARELQAAGAAGQAALERLIQSSPELASSLQKAAEVMERQVQATQRVGEAAESAAKRVQAASTAINSGGGFNRIGQGAEQLDRRLTTLNRTLGEVSGAMGFLGFAGGTVASRLEPARRAVGGLADVAATASAAFGAGAGGGLFGALTRFVPLVGAGVLALEGLRGIIGVATQESDKNVSAVGSMEEALRKLAIAAENAEEKQRRLKEETQKATAALLENGRAEITQRITAQNAARAPIENELAYLAAIRRPDEDTERSLRSRGQPVPDVIGARLSATRDQEADARARLAAIAAETDRLAGLWVKAGEDADKALRNIEVQGGRAEEGTRRANRAGADYASTMERLNEQADKAARTIVDRLLRETETDWQRYEREVSEAQGAMARLARDGQLTADEMARINAALEASSPAAQEASRAADAALKEQQQASQEYERVLRPAVEFLTQNDPNTIRSLEEAVR